MKLGQRDLCIQPFGASFCPRHDPVTRVVRRRRVPQRERPFADDGRRRHAGRAISAMRGDGGQHLAAVAGERAGQRMIGKTLCQERCLHRRTQSKKMPQPPDTRRQGEDSSAQQHATERIADGDILAPPVQRAARRGDAGWLKNPQCAPNRQNRRPQCPHAAIARASTPNAASAPCNARIAPVSAPTLERVPVPGHAPDSTHAALVPTRRLAYAFAASWPHARSIPCRLGGVSVPRIFCFSRASGIVRIIFRQRPVTAQRLDQRRSGQ